MRETFRAGGGRGSCPRTTSRGLHATSTRLNARGRRD